jgi:hypothetical protein
MLREEAGRHAVEGGRHCGRCHQRYRNHLSQREGDVRERERLPGAQEDLVEDADCHGKREGHCLWILEREISSRGPMEGRRDARWEWCCGSTFHVDSHLVNPSSCRGGGGRREEGVEPSPSHACPPARGCHPPRVPTNRWPERGRGGEEAARGPSPSSLLSSRSSWQRAKDGGGGDN